MGGGDGKGEVVSRQQFGTPRAAETGVALNPEWLEQLGMENAPKWVVDTSAFYLAEAGL